MQKLFTIILALCVCLAQGQTVNVRSTSGVTTTVPTVSGQTNAIKTAIAAIPKQSANIAQSTIDSLVKVIYNQVDAKYAAIIAKQAEQLRALQITVDSHSAYIGKDSIYSKGLSATDFVLFDSIGKVAAKLRPVVLAGKLSFSSGIKADTLTGK